MHSRAQRPSVGDAPAARPKPLAVSLHLGARGIGRTRRPASCQDAQGDSPGYLRSHLMPMCHLLKPAPPSSGTVSLPYTQFASHRLSSGRCYCLQETPNLLTATVLKVCRFSPSCTRQVFCGLFQKYCSSLERQ